MRRRPTSHLPRRLTRFIWLALALAVGCRSAPVATPTLVSEALVVARPSPTLAPTAPPSPTPSPLPPTATPAPSPSPTLPTLPATATLTESPTPSATATPSPPLPSPTLACPPVAGPFAALWAELGSALGCAQGGAIFGFIVEENFEGGRMFWREPVDVGQALVLFNDGPWRVFTHAPFVEGSPDFPCADATTPAQSPPTPRRGFGAMWCDIPAIRAGLGNALDAERGYTGSLQAFDNAFVVGTDYGATYIFYSGGRWQRR